MNIAAATADRKAVARVYRALGERGLNTGSSGNVSQRDGAGMVITPTGITAETVSADTLVRVALDGRVEGPGVPSSEWSMHAAIYAAFPEAGAIVHTHADACTALACLNESLPPFHYTVLGFGGEDVRCAPYTTFGTPELADMVVKALSDRTACLLGNHGMIATGADLQKALWLAVEVETLARQYFNSLLIGGPNLLNAEQIDATRRRFETYGQAKA